MGSLYNTCHCRKSGIASFVDLIDGVSLQETTDDATGISSKSVIDWRSGSKTTDLKPRITLRDEKEMLLKKQMTMKLDIIWFPTLSFQ